MSKGFVIFAQNSKDVDYVKQACALALSIKKTQTEINSVSIMTNDDVPEEYKSLFEHIIEIPWFNKTLNFLAAEHRWKIYHVTPYEQTIVLDSDMLVLDDISIWWKYLDNYDLKFCTKVKNYKDEVIEKDFKHRKTFIENFLPNVYCGLHYFKKSNTALAFFKTLEFVINNWEFCYGKYAPKDYQHWLSMDLASAIALKISSLEDEIVEVNCPLEFVHMKPAIQGWILDNAHWQNVVSKFMNSKGRLHIANIRQQKIFHYVEKDFLTSDIIDIIKEQPDARG
jgi:hypothetical protein